MKNKNEVRVLINADIKKEIKLTHKQLLKILKEKFPQISDSASVSYYNHHDYMQEEVEEIFVTWHEHNTTETIEEI